MNRKHCCVFSTEVTEDMRSLQVTHAKVSRRLGDGLKVSSISVAHAMSLVEAAILAFINLNAHLPISEGPFGSANLIFTRAELYADVICATTVTPDPSFLVNVNLTYVSRISND